MSFKAFTNFPTFNLQSPSNPNAKRSKEECFCALTIAQVSVQVQELPKVSYFHLKYLQPFISMKLCVLQSDDNFAQATKFGLGLVMFANLLLLSREDFA